MGGSSRNQDGGQQAQGQPSPYLSGGTQTFPGGYPGQVNALAAQLAQGYGQTPADILAMLNAMYRPMNLPALKQREAAPAPGGGGAPAPAVPPAPPQQPVTPHDFRNDIMYGVK